MFCKNCGNLIDDSGAFCTKCGTAVGTVQTDTVIRNNQSTSPMVSVRSFIDGQIKAQTVFVTAEDFIKGARPLRFRWYIALVGLLTVFIYPALPIFIAPLAFLVGGIYVSAFKLLGLNRRTYALSREIDLDDLTLFLRNNLSYLPFSDWKRGVPSTFGIKDTSINVIECTFEDKTIHRIQFPEGKGFYKIICIKTSTKSFLKNGVQKSSPLMYKNSYKVKPILEAAMQYYLTQQ